MKLKNAWQRLRMIWNFALGALVGGAGVASYFWFAAPPLTARPPDQVMVAPVRSDEPLPGAEPPPGWHFVPNGVQGCSDQYGCARPSFDSDFWKWVSTGEEGCADEHGCARPRLPGKGDTMPPGQAEKKPGGPEKKGEKPEARSESGAGPQPGGGPLSAEHESSSKPTQAGPLPDAAEEGSTVLPTDHR
jgi:hypothetical protein